MRAMKYLLVVIAAVCLARGARASEATNESAAERLGWQMAIHGRTFQDYGLWEAMDKTAALGIKFMSLPARVKLDGSNALDLVNLTDEQFASIRRHAAARGLTLVNAYVLFPADEKKCRKSFEVARQLGFDVLVGEPSEDALDTVDKLCQEYHVKVAIHDHPAPSRYWKPENVLAALKGRSPLMGACADTGHWVRSGLNPVECLRKLQGHVICLHFKDLNAKARNAHDVPWGTGVSNCKGMMEELKRQNFHGAFCVEYEYHWKTSVPEIAQCKAFFDKTCAELGPPLNRD